MRDFLKNNGLILMLYFMLVSMVLFYVVSYGKVETHLFVNSFVGNKYTNAFYYYLTYLGDGRIAVPLILLVVTANVRWGLYALLSFITASLSANVLKYFYFGDATRPNYIFQWIHKHPIIYVEGVDLNIHNSFPSGHATQAFAIFMCLVFVSKRTDLKFLFFTVAALTAFSRVYLSQHWLIDVTAGSMIGTLFSILYYYLIIVNNKFEKFNLPLTEYFGSERSQRK